MTNMSFLLFAATGLFAVTAIILFFTLDIAKCWRMVLGKYSARSKTQRKSEKKANTKEAIAKEAITNKAIKKKAITKEAGTTDKIATEKLKRFVPAPAGETVLLDYAGDQGTELLGTIGLELIQDIVYMQDTAKTS